MKKRGGGGGKKMSLLLLHPSLLYLIWPPLKESAKERRKKEGIITLSFRDNWQEQSKTDVASLSLSFFSPSLREKTNLI